MAPAISFSAVVAHKGTLNDTDVLEE